MYPANAQESQKLSDPFPVEVPTIWRAHNFRSPISFSADGVWIAHTIFASDTIERGNSGLFTPTGVPLAEGARRREATVTNHETDESFRLGSAKCSSWAPVWAPDGSKVAFYSDEGGDAGLWVWDANTKQSRRLSEATVRPLFGFELPCWSPDGEHLLVKILPEGKTLAEMNELARRRPARSDAAGEKTPAVTVQRVTPTNVKPSTTTPVNKDSEITAIPAKPTQDISRYLVDLAIINVETGLVQRLVKNVAVRFFKFSPDGRHISYSVFKGGEPNSQQSIFDIVTTEVANGTTKSLATNIRLAYGIEWSYSPDGQYLAYTPSGPIARVAVTKGISKEQMIILSTVNGEVTSISHKGAQIFDPGDGEYAPIWDESGRYLFGLGKGAVWRVDREKETVTNLVEVPGWHISHIVARSLKHTLWYSDQKKTSWALARDSSGTRSAIISFDAETGNSEIVLTEDANHAGIFNVDAVETTGKFAFVSWDLKHLPGLRVFDTLVRGASYCPALNPDQDRYELGTAKVIEWKGLDGEPLRGALLLPPGEHTNPHPLVVWVYGGSYGSKAINRFGLASSDPVFNMHVLATRGYAVLFPDIPLKRPGETTRSLMNSVIPGIDAAIELGYADPERLAIMGQSFGAANVQAILTRTDRFKAAIISAAVGHPDLFAGYLFSEGYYEQGQGNMGGTIWEYPDRYRENSPLFKFDQITTPILMGHGEKDGDLVAPNAVFRALKRLDKSVEYRLYHGEGHVITNPANVVDFWNRRLDFLAEHLQLSYDDSGRIDH